MKTRPPHSHFPIEEIKGFLKDPTLQNLYKIYYDCWHTPPGECATCAFTIICPPSFENNERVWDLCMGNHHMNLAQIYLYLAEVAARYEELNGQ